MGQPKKCCQELCLFRLGMYFGSSSSLRWKPTGNPPTGFPGHKAGNPPEGFQVRKVRYPPFVRQVEGFQVKNLETHQRVFRSKAGNPTVGFSVGSVVGSAEVPGSSVVICGFSEVTGDASVGLELSCSLNCKIFWCCSSTVALKSFM